MLTGCNYWASHAAIDMWLDWRPDIVAADLDKLVTLGFRIVRIFPVWRDFQPLEIGYEVMNWPRELRLHGQPLPHTGAGRFGVDEVMLDRLEEFLNLAQEKAFKVDIALITGWMSGQMFTPPAFAGRDLLTDPLVLRWQTALVRAIVGRFKDHPAVAAWSPGNETNCMQKLAGRQQAALWLRLIADAIRAIDQKHPIDSGMHSLASASIDRIDQEGPVWTIQDNAEIFDVLTVHPYPLFTPLCDISRPDEFRNCFHAAAESVYYSTIGNRPCAVEEFGTFARMFMGDDVKRDYLRASLWNCWAHGCPEFLWWCACSHTFAHVSPYTWSSCERELGLLDEEGKIYEFASVFRDFNAVMKRLPVALPPAEFDAVCVLTEAQDSWANAYGCFLLAEQAGLRVRFVGSGDPLPEARLYFVPGICGPNGLSQPGYEALLQRAESGARVVFTCKDGILAPSDRYWHFIPRFIEHREDQLTVSGDGFAFEAKRFRRYGIEPGEAEIWAQADGEPVLFEQKHGKGSIVLLTVPVEEYAASAPDAINRPDEFQAYLLYKKLAAGFVAEQPVSSNHPKCSVSCHWLNADCAVAVAVNNALDDCREPLRPADGWMIKESYHGTPDLLPHHDALICRIVRSK